MQTATARKFDDVVYGESIPARPALTLVPARTSDYALARQAAAGTMTALADLYERHYRRVYAVCMSMTRNPAQAEDLTHDVFIHLCKKIGSFRGESQFTTWLHRLTVNLVLMHFRRAEHRQQTRESPVEFPCDSKTRRPPRSAPMLERIALDSALSQLPRGCRAVFVLFEIGGYKHDEIADLLGCSSGTSKSQLHRARMRLRRLLSSLNPTQSK